MIYARSLRPAVQLLGAFTGVALGALGNALIHVGDALLRRI